ncbi:MAG: M15 family metallopeptidase [Ignavibacteria bacterium]|nr:M15 family metallopeptidase [Ignavibacteria bacterium]
MKKFFFYIVVIVCCCSFVCSKPDRDAKVLNQPQQVGVSPELGVKLGSDTTVREILVNSDIPPDLQRILKAYPDYIDSVDYNTIFWKDGTTMIYDDGIKDKTFEEKLDNPDIEDMMSIEYIKGDNYPNPPPANYDPGRIRYEPFFEKIYGENETEVRSFLVKVRWMPATVNKSILITSANGVNRQLQAVSDELDRLSSELKKYVNNPAGTFVYRVIAGTNRKSTHSYGIAIDINTEYSDYWRWDKTIDYKNKIPLEIVKVFEKYGFIWGGKWYHYDTMHFEYRPELLIE